MSSPYSEHKYDSLEPRNAESGRRLADFFLIRLIEKMDNVESICDLGCSNGHLSGRLDAMAYHVIGIDASQSGVGLASKTYISESLEFVCATIDEEYDLSCKKNEIKYGVCFGK
jgi:2-polyprenyl-3-methyl-5-hydroxy-6-metoxy-1,4-benzoquinol methylase